MDLCSDGHDEICYADKKCPMCVMIKEYGMIIAELEDQLALALG